MEKTPEILGYRRQGDYWSPCHTNAQILQTSDKDFIPATDRVDLLRRLEAMALPGVTYLKHGEAILIIKADSVLSNRENYIQNARDNGRCDISDHDVRQYFREEVDIMGPYSLGQDCLEAESGVYLVKKRNGSYPNYFLTTDRNAPIDYKRRAGKKIAKKPEEPQPLLDRGFFANLLSGLMDSLLPKLGWDWYRANTMIWRGYDTTHNNTGVAWDIKYILTLFRGRIRPNKQLTYCLKEVRTRHEALKRSSIHWGHILLAADTIQVRINGKHLLPAAALKKARASCTRCKDCNSIFVCSVNCLCCAAKEKERS